MTSRRFSGTKVVFAVLLLATLGVLAAGVSAVSAAEPAQADAKAAPVLRHVVLFGFKPEATPEDVKKVEDAFAALPTKIPCIMGYEWGTNVSPEKLDQGHTHCFFLTFANEKDRDAYLVHPEHKAFGKLLGPYLAKVTVVDYFVKP
jgi:hypothetical protein